MFAISGDNKFSFAPSLDALQFHQLSHALIAHAIAACPGLFSVLSQPVLEVVRRCYQWKAGQVAVPQSIDYLPRVIADRSSVLVTELGNVLTFEMPDLTIQIRQRAQTFGYLDGLKGG